MPRKPRNKSGDSDQNTNARNTEESSMNKTSRSASMGDDVEETGYGNKKSREEDTEEIDTGDDEDKDESSPRKR